MKPSFLPAWLFANPFLLPLLSRFSFLFFFCALIKICLLLVPFFSTSLLRTGARPSASNHGEKSKTRRKTGFGPPRLPTLDAVLRYGGTCPALPCPAWWKWKWKWKWKWNSCRPSAAT
ncbi:hypothetical protein BO70DRAFT_106257 [Aspergillus heteromorphus CBS 117.55]|uniref:Uncharacterized protein n=1 Tax=Aspergillus heteromorphus CBS 117.55 TaxID=1448321 RepID=A0A317VMV4_9EURO|nr:uncharacterized protein BO70DRAFT_106257 [Aspergillus heteromorphus CBS 117.55]PWY74417.1 hypothetical protein BO70DRAFT_106257 [Aspergillus heteromorphus CBS 117.55]